MSQTVFVQLGTFSNFIGSHFWNQQQQSWYDDDDLNNYTRVFYEKRSLSRREYHPRLVAVDAPGQFGGNVLQETPENANYDVLYEKYFNDQEYNECISNKIISPYPKLNPHPYNEFLNQTCNDVEKQTTDVFNFKSTVTYSTDYLIPVLDAENQILCYNECLDKDQTCSNGFWYQYEEKLRKQLEYVDILDCLHISIDFLSSFCDIGLYTLNWVKEEIPKTTLIISGYVPPTVITKSQDTLIYHDESKKLLINFMGAKFLDQCIQESFYNQSIFLTNYSTKEKSSSLYEASAASALALECCSGPFFKVLPTHSIGMLQKHCPFSYIQFKCFQSSDPFSQKELLHNLWDTRSNYTFKKNDLTKQNIILPEIASNYVFGGFTKKQLNDYISSLHSNTLYTINENSLSLSVPFPRESIGFLSKENKALYVARTNIDMCIKKQIYPIMNSVKRCYMKNQLTKEIIDQEDISNLLYNFDEYFQHEEDIANEYRIFVSTD
jgi:hypothetical protein